MIVVMIVVMKFIMGLIVFMTNTQHTICSNKNPIMIIMVMVMMFMTMIIMMFMMIVLIMIIIKIIMVIIIMIKSIIIINTIYTWSVKFSERASN